MTVDVLGCPYRVKFCKMPKGTYGDCDTDKKVIRINKRHKGQSGTLVHEVIHAALYESGLAFILHSALPEGTEEALVRAVEHGLKTADLIPEIEF